MMPLTLCETGKKCVIRKVGGSAELRQHLENLGCTVGTQITVVASIGGNLILNVKESRVALSRELAQRIMV